MNSEPNPKDPSWINTLLFVSTFLTLAMVLTTAYKGWKEDRALHPGGEKHSEIIADITVNLSGTPNQEHCLTCHPQGRRPSFSRQTQVSKDHPNIAPHSIYELGCAGCHLGEGMARDFVISHGVPGNDARKILAGEDLQASCYKCHELKPFPGAEKAWEGFQLFSLNACDTCHNVDGLGGGRYGPDLSEVGSLLGLKQIQGAVEDPKADPENSIMPKFSLSRAQIKAISYFLKSRVKDPFFETPMVKMMRIREQTRAREKAASKVPAPDEDILRDMKCLACHKFEKEDGQIAPDLTYTAYMRKEDYIRNFLHEPAKEIPGAIMPWIRMTPQEEEGVIQRLQQKDTENHLHGMNPKHLYMMLCQRCHAAQGDGLGIIQPNLADFPRAFWKNAEFFRRISDERIVKSIEKGVPGTSMPPYGELLGRGSVNSLIDLIFREFIRIKRDEKRSDLSVLPKPSVLLKKEQTEKDYMKYCFSCHGFAGTGKGPEYLKYLPRPRDLTNRPYFGSLTDDRIAMAIFHGVPGTGMSPFDGKISAETVWSLVAKIREFSGTEVKTGQADG